MKIYTRTGDTGFTALFGGDRVSKDHLRIEAYGTVDETNAVLGMARVHVTDTDQKNIEEILHRIQSELFVLGADLATPNNSKAQVPRIEPAHVEQLEANIDALEQDLPALKHFILPGGSAAASTIHLARTVCRRAERRTVALAQHEPVNEQALVYLNRLSDLLFVMSRSLNQSAGIEEEAWRPQSPAQPA